MTSEKLYLIGEKDGKIITATESEIINNALEQEKDGVNPHFAFYDYKNQRPIGNKGYYPRWNLYVYHDRIKGVTNEINREVYYRKNTEEYRLWIVL